MAKDKKKKRAPAFDDPFSSTDDILDQFFSPTSKGESKKTSAPANQKKESQASSQEVSPQSPVPKPQNEAPGEKTPDTQGALKAFPIILKGVAANVTTLEAAIEKGEGAPELQKSVPALSDIAERAASLGLYHTSDVCRDVANFLRPLLAKNVSPGGDVKEILLVFSDLLLELASAVSKEGGDESVVVGEFLELMAGAEAAAILPAPGATRLSPQVELFLQELEENIDNIDAALLALEKEPSDKEKVSAIFRVTHNMKGIGNTLKLKNLETICHEIENMLAIVRSPGDPDVTAAQIDLLFEFNDLLRLFQASLTQTGGEGEADITGLLERLETGWSTQQRETQVATAPASPTLDDERRAMLESYLPDFLLEYSEHVETLDGSLLELENDPGSAAQINNTFRAIHSVKGMSNALGFLRLGEFCHAAESILAVYREGEKPVTPTLIDHLLAFTDILRLFRQNIEKEWVEGDVDTGTVIINLKAELAGEKSDALKPSKAPVETGASNKQAGERASEKISTIRVNVDRLDLLMNSVGELVLLRNRYAQLNQRLTQGERGERLIEEFNNLASHFGMVTTALQDSVMSTRMLPVGNLFSKFNRVVRDLSRSMGKEVDLNILGAETELDKNLVESISDPLMHIIRNCVDHAIEHPDDRVAAGKLRRGTISLNAFQEGNSIIVEIADDGRGINPDTVGDKALEKGLLEMETLEKMTDSEKINLIFLPGFSTTEIITDVSGRGVGMDVVRNNVEKLRGQIDISSQVGRGTAISLRIPLTLAIMQTLLCQLGAEQYAIPLSSVIETVRVQPGDIETISGSPVIRIREEILPVLYLGDLLTVTGPEKPTPEEVDIVVVKIGIQQVGLALDKTLGQAEVLIKPLDALEGIFTPHFISGATILGDGAIALIIDVAQVVQMAKLIDDESVDLIRRSEEKIDTAACLLISDGAAEQYGVELCGIKKIDIIDPRRIEFVGGREVLQYDGDIMPVCRAPDITTYTPPEYLARLCMVLIEDEGRKAGLIVNNLEGLARTPRRALEAARGKIEPEKGLIVNKRVTLVFTAAQIMEAAYQRAKENRYSARATHQGALIGEISTVLLADDSLTQRTMIGAALEEAGFAVRYAHDGAEAMDHLDDTVDLIITDLEMPRMDGFEFTEKVKAARPLMPVIMLTNYYGDDNLSRALNAGVDHFLEKFDPQKLLDTVESIRWSSKA